MIASRVGGIPDFVDDDMLIAPGDPELLADLIAALASDPDQLNDMARRRRVVMARHPNTILLMVFDSLNARAKA